MVQEMKDRVFVTGIGILSAIGNDLDVFAHNIVKGTNGIAPVTAFETIPLHSHIGGEVRCDLNTHFSPTQQRRMDRCSKLTVVAARQAIERAGLVQSDYDPDRVGIFMGTTLGGMIGATEYFELLNKRNLHKITYLQDYPLYSAGARIIEQYGFTGPNLAFSTACSSSNVALGYATDCIRYKRCDIAFAGGVDTMAKITLAGFNALKNVSSDAIRPFDKNRSGVVLSEGAAVLVLESEDGVRTRGAIPLAEIAGYGMSTDAYHMTAPDSTGRGPALAMNRALKNSNMSPGDIDHINAHGTATRHNDEIESRAIRKILGAHVDSVPITSTKSQHGHALGAAGALEAVAAIVAIRTGKVPPTLNLQQQDPRCRIDVVANKARDHRSKAVLSNNFGFGGNNCAIIFACH